MVVICILKKGTTKQFSLIDYSADGELLGSQGKQLIPLFPQLVIDYFQVVIQITCLQFGIGSERK